MILYTEKQLEEAWYAHCKTRASLGLPWYLLEDFRPIFEEEMEELMLEDNK